MPAATKPKEEDAPAPDGENGADQEKQKDVKLTGEGAKAADAQQQLSSEVPAAARTPTGKDGRGTQGGWMDQKSVRDDNDAFEGHFVTIDVSDAEARQALEDQGLTTTDNYGVYQEVAVADPETGIPVVAVVKLRGDAGALVRVPYKSLRRAVAGRR